jgi:hypothetical protein
MQKASHAISPAGLQHVDKGAAGLIHKMTRFSFYGR